MSTTITIFPSKRACATELGFSVSFTLGNRLDDSLIIYFFNSPASIIPSIFIFFKISLHLLIYSSFVIPSIYNKTVLVSVYLPILYSFILSSFDLILRFINPIFF